MRILIVTALMFLVNTIHISAQQPDNDVIKSIYESYQNKVKSATAIPIKQHKNFYKKYISFQISATCQFQKTCSEFMLEAIHHKGIFTGFLTGIDRLSRCGTSDKTYNYLPSLKSADQNSLLDEWYFYN